MPQRFEKVLVTGGAGYVGSVLTKELLEKGYKVRVLDLLHIEPHGTKAWFLFLGNPDYEFVSGDLRSKEVVANAVRGVQAVIHLAGIVGFPACQNDPVGSREVNVQATRTLVDAVHGIMPILFASSGVVYGKVANNLCTEETPLNPLSEYGKQKLEAEAIVSANKEFVIYRFATAFGVSPRMRYDILPHDFTHRAITDGKLVVYEKNFMRTFVHVRDMANAFIFALEHYDAMRGEAYNVGDNNLNLTKEAICLLIRSKVQYELEFGGSGHDADERNYVVSYEKLNRAGFKTTVSMEAGIEELVDLLRDKAAEA